MHMHAVAGRVIILDASRPYLEEQVREGLPDDWHFGVVQLNTGRAGALAVVNSDKPDSVVVAIGDMGISNGQKVIFEQNLSAKKAHVVHFESTTPADHIITLVEQCVRKNAACFA